MSPASRRAAAAAALFLSFLIVAALVRAGLTGPIDAAILHLRNAAPPILCDAPGIVDALAARTPAGWTDRLLLAITMLGDGWTRTVLTIAAAVLLLARGRRRSAGLLAVAMAAETILETIVKRLFARMRPDVGWWHACWLSHHIDWSFPSGHAAGSMVLYPLLGALLLRTKGRRGPIAGGALSLAIGASRALLGVHWASDVVAGWLLGGGCLLGALAWTRSRAARRAG